MSNQTSIYTCDSCGLPIEKKNPTRLHTDKGERYYFHVDGDCLGRWLTKRRNERFEKSLEIEGAFREEA